MIVEFTFTLNIIREIIFIPESVPFENRRKNRPSHSNVTNYDYKNIFHPFM